MNKLSVVLDEQAMLELQQVLMDEDEEGALAFLQKHIVPSIPRSSSRACDSTRLNPFLLKKDK